MRTALFLVFYSISSHYQRIATEKALNPCFSLLITKRTFDYNNKQTFLSVYLERVFTNAKRRTIYSKRQFTLGKQPNDAPEHKEAWINMQEQENDVPLHEELADDQWQELGMIIIDALNHTHDVIVTYWVNGRYQELTCTIDKLDELNKRIKVVFSDDYEWLNLRLIKSIVQV